MRRAALLALVLAVGAADTAAAAPARLLVEGREYNLTLSRPQLRHGTAIIQLANRGQDPHDLALARVGGGRRYRIGKTLPGELGTWRGRLRPGRYRMFCTIEGHRGLGMRAVLRVR
jgi:hypothetical protein